MGVWIETYTAQGKSNLLALTGVTPCMGVWIETERLPLVGSKGQSHPVWVCGLKLLWKY